MCFSLSIVILVVYLFIVNLIVCIAHPALAKNNYDSCLAHIRTNNRLAVKPSGTRDKVKKSVTVPKIPGQLEPMHIVENF